MIIHVICFTARGCASALRVADALVGDDVTVYSRSSSATPGASALDVGLSEWTGSSFAAADALVFVGATGIAVRAIAPYLKSKATDPAVVCMDEACRFVISLVSGHVGGCNRLAERIAAGVGAIPVVTTATDVNGLFAVDEFAAVRGMRIGSFRVAKEVAARLLDGRPVSFSSDFPISGDLPRGLTLSSEGEVGIAVTAKASDGPYGRTLVLTPRCCTVGIGCRRGKTADEIWSVVEEALAGAGISADSVARVASIDIKADEPGIAELAGRLSVPAVFYTAEELAAVPGDFPVSEKVMEVAGVGCVCERAAAASGGRLVVRRYASSGVTAAVAMDDLTVDFDKVI